MSQLDGSGIAAAFLRDRARRYAFRTSYSQRRGELPLVHVNHSARHPRAAGTTIIEDETSEALPNVVVIDDTTRFVENTSRLGAGAPPIPPSFE